MSPRTLLIPFLAVLALILTVTAALAQQPDAARPVAPKPPTPATASPATDLLAPAPVVMPDTTAGKMMTRVLAWLNDPKAALGADDFDEGFLKQVPYEKLQEVTAQVREQCGAFTPVRIDKVDGDRGLIVRVKPAKLAQSWQVIVGVTGEDKVQTLLLRPAPMDEPALRDWADLDARLSALPGRKSFGAYLLRTLTPEGEPPSPASPKALKLAAAHTFHADERLAIGSTFKLYVLGALAEAVQAGNARWDEKLAIKNFYKSLPTGRMQDEPEGAEFPLSRYADLMISISDNTATDHLIHRLGRERVEAYMSGLHAHPSVNMPLLTTRELSALRLSSDATLVNRWLAADTAVRRDMLLADDPSRPTRPAGPTHNPGEIAAWVLNLGGLQNWKTPRHIDKIEWFASAEECCRVMADLYQREQRPGMEPVGHALRLNPGLDLSGQRWIKTAYKGGSEPGVMNLTFLLTRDDGQTYAASIGWNDTDKAIDEAKLAAIMTRALELLSTQP
jgi:hypothetical protein